MTSDHLPSKTLDAKSLRKIAVRIFVGLGSIAIVIDTLPGSWGVIRPVKGWVNTQLSYLGLSQGDWPLFAPDPVPKNGAIIAEVVDGRKNVSKWSSPDWAKATVAEKFYRFRHVNYFQRLDQNLSACADLADYLKRAIPEKESVEPSIRWSESNEMLPPAELTLPIVEIKLYLLRHRMLLTEDEPWPGRDDAVWNTQYSLLIKREYTP